MRGQKTKTFRVDFFVVTSDQEREHDLMRELLSDGRKYTDALELNPGDDEKYQVRSIVSLSKGKSFKAVLGQCRFREKPIQGTADGREEDVELKPGHGLVEKNHFLFFAERNLLVYQRNSSGSPYSRFQRYAGRAVEGNIAFEPILTKDSYQRLLDSSANARRVELSFQPPKDPSLYQDLWMQEAINLVNEVGGVSARSTISVGRTNRTLVSRIKDAAVMLARGGLAKVARVQIEDEQEPIDLIADRVIGSITVPLQQNGRPNSEDIYAALEEAQHSRSKDIKHFFGK